ncbi:MAG TPA: N-acetylmuramoyl-L-alanine amidase [Solirubrobacteraceae bacterium]|nr:N-acetylmuramoyl-L-alanine amidase [Solirubrobacteraceae bacterium]
MPARELTRRSLLAAAAGALAGGLLRPRGAFALAHAAGLELAGPTLPAGGGQPPIVAREVWAQGRCTPRVAPEYGSVELAFVHHTDSPNGYGAGEVPAMLRSIFAFHRYGNGWNDIGYNFVVDRFGRIFEARAGGIDEPVIGAQAGGYNYCSTGIAVLGTYSAQPISPAAQAALVRLLAWKLALHGAPVQGGVVVRVDPVGAVYSRFPANARVALPRVAGHRNADSTECPGNALYGELASIRLAAARLQGVPAQVTIGVAPPAAGQAPAGGQAPAASEGGTQTPPAGALATLAGRLALLDGTPLAGAPIALQVRSSRRRGELVQEQTVAQAQTAADGSWSVMLYPLTGGAGDLAAGTWLRALCPGAPKVPAAASTALRLTQACSFVPPLPPPAPSPTPAG